MPTMDENLLELRKRSNTLFKRPYNGIPVRIAPIFAAHQIHGFVRRDTGEEITDSNATFKIFDLAHQGTALVLSRQFSKIAYDQPDVSGLEDVLDAAEAEFAIQNSDLVKYALSVFITNNSLGRNLYIPPVIEQSPELFIPQSQVVSDEVESLGGLGEEAMLDYFREDPDFNSHHTQWHRVYPAGGAEDPNNPSGPLIAKDRQGELFWYMHQQMLVRYDTERVALGLAPVMPFDDYRANIHEGYWAEEIIADRYSGRTADQHIEGLRFSLPLGRSLDVTDLEASRERLLEAASTGKFITDGQLEISLSPDARGATLLGATLEANAEGVAMSGEVAEFGGLHNLGHVFISALSGPRGGVMGDTSAAVRDPVFYRWHRHIDDLFVTWQEQLPAYDLGHGAPPVKLRKDANGQSMDIGLALLRDLAPNENDGTQFDGAAFGAVNFGGENWDTPLKNFVGDAGKLTRTLQTGIGTYPLVLPDGRQFTILHLDHAEFAYFFRLENTSDAEQRVTVRIFIASREHAEDRRWWIEMDKFLEVLSPREKAVVYRPARLSSVVRKPARRPSDPWAGPQDPNDDYCNCGWPYHMLLPRGKEGPAGMPFRLFVILTNAVDDLAGAERKCGSVSFCGSKDQKYPDNQMMGYPFDRPFRSRKISETIAEAAFRHIAALDFAILHDPAVP